MKKKVLVTGGGGYIGSVLTEKLIKRGLSVVILDNFSFSDIGIKHLKKNPNLTVLKGDIRNKEDINKAFGNRNISAVIHLAAISDGRSGRRDSSLTKEINQVALYQFAKKAKSEGVNRFIFASTFGVYGNQYKISLTEDLQINPVDPYSLSKAEGEKVLKQLNSSNFITTSLRIAMVYGVSPRMRFDFIINNMTIKAITDRKLIVLGGSQKRPQIHIDDITDYFIRILEIRKDKISGNIFNSGGNNPSIIEIAKIIKKNIKCIKIEIQPRKKNEDSFILNSDKIKNELGLKPSYTINDAVNQIRKCYENGKWKNILDSIYYN